MNPYGIIYSALNTSNGKRYIGQTVNTLGIRRTEHIRKMAKKKTYFATAYKKDGPFLWVILDWAGDKKELDIKEQHWIQFYNTTNKKYGYNMMGGGQGGNRTFTKEHRDNIRKAKLGKKRGPHSDATKQKMRQAHLGYRHTDEALAKMSKRWKGVPKSLEQRKKIGLSVTATKSLKREHQ